MLVTEESSYCGKKEEKREGQACPGRSDILKGTVFGPPPTPLTGLGCRGSEDAAALPFRLNSVPERAHVDLLFIHGHHIHVTPALVSDDSCVHGGLTDA